MSKPKHILSAAVVVLNKENEILLLKSPKRDWEIPGGRVEKRESIRSGAIRETKEETGIDIEIIKYCGAYQNVQRSICSHLFLGKPIGGTFTTSEESLEIGYFPIEKALEMVKWSNYRDRILDCLNNEKHPFLIEF
ncbi:NUDIX hydrolase [Ectobacillus panaciterrae]|uniref:NUDIX hydrolase n=1 Tax=Ectobacillus panaciterrae TaxID=363872 RepID=UPI000420FFFC|nr:NUDIX hydrolase [Ectobacillus panaciterrae]